MEPRLKLRQSGGVSLELDALKIPGATPGQVLAFLDDGGGGVEGLPVASPVGPGSTLRRELGLVSGRQQVATVVGGAGEPWVVLGAETISPADWSLGGTTAWALRLHAAVTLLGLHGEVRLWNATDAVEAVAPVAFAAVATTFANAAANIVAGAKLYELQARLLDGAVPADMLNVLKATLLVTSS